MKRLFPLIPILITIAGCSAKQQPKLIEPLDWIRMGMERSKVLKHLPLKGSRNTITPGYIRLQKIKEPTYIKNGLTSLILTFRKSGSTLRLNAVQMSFDAKKTDRKKLTTMLIRKYGKPTGKIWKIRGKYTIDILSGPAGEIKVTFDTPG